jgi:hypothetical protein
MASSDKPTAVHFTLIFFVMLSLILGVVTYLNVRDLGVKNAELKAKTDELSQANTGISTRIAEIDELKSRLGYNFSDIGSAGAPQPNTVLGKLAEDLQSMGRDLQEPTVAATLTSMRTALDQAMSEKAAKEAALKEEQDRMLALQSQYQGQLQQVQDSQISSETNLQKFIFERDEIVKQKDDELTRLNADYSRLQLERAQLEDQMGRQERDLNSQIADLQGINRRLQQELDEFRRVSFEVPDGEIRTVDNSSRSVWINLGSQDRLREQITFSVYAKDNHGVGRGPEDIKGRVEVMRILGPHLAEARILEEDLDRPMAPGDVVYTPAWSAGLVESFAFVGEIDVDQDGQSDRALLHDLLASNNSNISLEVDEQATIYPEGARITNQNTKFLVIGYIPDPAQFASADPELDRVKRLGAVQSELIDQAQQQGVRVVSLNDFLGFMGYRPSQRLFLPGNDMPYTLRAGRPAAGSVGDSGGNTSELFREGRPGESGKRSYAQ